MSSGKPTTAGIGLRLSHIAEMAAIRPPVGFLEINQENFLANPHAMQLLIELSRHYPISVHSVRVLVGSATGLDRAHLRRVCALVDRINPLLISGHLAWSTHQGEFRGPIQQMLRLTVPQAYASNAGVPNAFAGMVPGFFEFLRRERGLRETTLVVERILADKPLFSPLARPSAALRTPAEAPCCLTKPITLQHNRKASVASLRRLIGFLRNGDRVQSGMTDRFHRNTQRTSWGTPKSPPVYSVHHSRFGP